MANLINRYQAGEGIYQLFDKVMLLDKGRQVFYGPPSQARAYFESLGYRYVYFSQLNLVQNCTLSVVLFLASQRRIISRVAQTLMSVNLLLDEVLLMFPQRLWLLRLHFYPHMSPKQLGTNSRSLKLTWNRIAGTRRPSANPCWKTNAVAHRRGPRIPSDILLRCGRLHADNFSKDCKTGFSL
jgi:hypothetical protein